MPLDAGSFATTTFEIDFGISESFDRGTFTLTGRDVLLTYVARRVRFEDQNYSRTFTVANENNAVTLNPSSNSVTLEAA